MSSVGTSSFWDASTVSSTWSVYSGLRSATRHTAAVMLFKAGEPSFNLWPTSRECSDDKQSQLPNTSLTNAKMPAKLRQDSLVKWDVLEARLSDTRSSYRPDRSRHCHHSTLRLGLRGPLRSTDKSKRKKTQLSRATDICSQSRRSPDLLPHESLVKLLRSGTKAFLISRFS